MHLCFALHEGQAENHLYVFPYDLNTRLTFIVSFFMIFRLCSVSCLQHGCCYQDYVFHDHVLSSFDPSSQTLTYMIKIV
jgi:hypothetical protein